MDPELLLFQRLIIASQSLDDRSPIFKYQLCSYSPSLFDSSLMLLKSLKPVFADAIWAKLPSDATEPKGKYNMSWTVAHSFIGSFGLEDSQNIEYLQDVGCQTHHSQEDADLLISSDRLWKAQEGRTLFSWGTTLISLSALLHRIERFRIIFSLSYGPIQQNDMSGTYKF